MKKELDPRFVDKALENFRALTSNPYPGRGMVVGMDSAGESLVQIYWLMGRSDNSRNRIFVQEGDIVKTAPVDAEKVKDPSLIFYTAMAQNRHSYAVSNGAQTIDALSDGPGLEKSLGRSLEKWIYEPDSPNYTPRITAKFAMNSVNPFSAEISILKRSPFSGNCDRFLYDLIVEPGLGYCVTTYSGDGEPLPSFKGDPYLLPIFGDGIKQVAQFFWITLNEENRVSLVVKFINIKTKKTTVEIINKYTVK